MRKILKHFPFNKLFVSLFVLFYTFLPSAEAMGVVIEDSSLDNSSEDISKEVVSDPEEIANPSVLEEEDVEEPLFVYEDGVYTVDAVVEGEEYVYPDDDDVRIKFTSVTEEGNLVISKVLLTEEEKEELNTSDDYGWDISSSMINGSFAYDLTLPNTLDSDNVEVKYSEDGEVYESVDNNNIEVNEDVIYIEGLDHFTIFVVVSPNTAENCNITITGYSPNPNVNCFPTIQQAINVANNDDEIYVAHGVYNEGYISINDKSVDLIGDNATIKAAAADATAVITINNATTPMTIEGFTIDADNVSGRSGIYIQNWSSNITVKDNNIINFTDKGVLISNGDNNSILNNTITSSTSGSHAGVYVDNNSENNVIDNNNTISLPTSGTGNLYNVHFAGNITGENTVNDNILDGGKRSFQQDGGVTGTTIFSANTIENPSFAGVYLNGGSANILDNSFKDSVRPIEFSSVNNVTILDNEIDGSTYHGIKIWNYSGDIIINNNSFENIGSNALDNEMTGGKIVDARYNWWGDIDNSGPYDMWEDSSIPNTNLDGEGYGARGFIDYSSWVKADTIIPTTTTPKMFVSKDGGITFEERDFVTKGDLVRVETEAEDNFSGVDYVRFIIQNPSGGYISYQLIHAPIDPSSNTYRAEFTIPTDGKYIDTHKPISEAIDALIYNVRAYDNAGNYNHGETKYFTYDKTPPTISEPRMYVSRDGQPYKLSNTVKPSDLVKVQAEAEDSSSGIRSVEFRIQDKTTGEYVAPRVFKATPISANTYEYIFEIPNDGKYINTHNPISQEYLQLSYWVRAHDIVGNYAHGKSELFTFDITNPSVPALEYPIAGEYINDNTPLMQWENSTDYSSGVKGYYYRIYYNCSDKNDPSTCASVYPNSAGLWVTLSQLQAGKTTDGVYYWQVQAVDHAYNKSDWSKLEKFTIDTKDPIVELTSPEDNFLTKQTIILQTWTSDEINLDHYQYRSCTNNPEDEYCNNEYSISTGKIASRTVNNNNITFWWQVRGVDKAGNLGEWTNARKITIDNTSPTSTFALDPIYPWDYTPPFRKTRTLTFSGNAADNLSGIADITYRYSSDQEATWTDWENTNVIPTGGTFESTDEDFSFTINLPEDGLYIFEVRAEDNAGNIQTTAYDQVTVNVDTVPPTINFTATTPTGGSFVRGIITIEAEYNGTNDTDPRLHSIYLSNLYPETTSPASWCFQAYVNLASGVYNCQMNTTQVDDGNYSTLLSAQDKAFNQTYGVTRTFTVDNKPPEGSIDYLYYTVGDTYKDHFITNDNTPVLGGTCSDENLDTVTLEINDQIQTIECLSDNTWKSEPTGTLADGMHTASLTLTDKAGNIILL